MSASLTAAEGLAYLAPRPRYTAARISAAAKAIGHPMVRLEFNGCYGWNVYVVGRGDFLPFRTLADVAAWLIADAEPVAVMAAPAPMAPGPILPGEVRPPATPKQDGPPPELPSFRFPAPLFEVLVWRGIAEGWQQTTYSPRDQVSAARLAHTMSRACPHLRYCIAPV